MGSTLLLIKRTTIDPLHLWVINGSEDTFSDDSYSDSELVEKGKKVYKRGCTKLPPVPTTPDQRWLIAPKGLK